MIHTGLFALLLPLCAGAAPGGIGRQVDIGWESGCCHIIVIDGVTLVQLEERPFGPIGWPIRGLHANWFNVERDELHIPCCMRTALRVRRQGCILGFDYGNGVHWASGMGFWWAAYPAGRWQVYRIDP